MDGGYEQIAIDILPVKNVQVVESHFLYLMLRHSMTLLLYVCSKLYQADGSKLGDSDSSGFWAAEEELDDGCLGLVPDSWTVPQIPSPPTASGLNWSKNSYSSRNCTAFVPDICDSNSAKRRRQF